MPSIGLTSTSGGAVGTISAADVVDVLDTVYVDASSTNIPASSALALEVVSSTADDINQVQCIDTTGELIGMFLANTVGLDPIVIFGPGCDQTISIQIPASSTLYIRNLKDATISVGDFALNLIK